MSVWFAVPSKREAKEVIPTLQVWRDQGYKIALWREDGIQDLLEAGVPASMSIQEPYPGYSKAVNGLVKKILLIDPFVTWIVTGGDDTLPDMTRKADEIASECSTYFKGTFGVMQPTGDPWASHSIERICGSPWMGRSFCERINSGQGPMWPEYFHMFNDEEMQEVTKRLGILWQRRDLTHHHQHWARGVNDLVDFSQKVPDFLAQANSRVNWDSMKAIFERRRSQGFPGHHPLPPSRSTL